jgi:catechol 2,3-dioxygenase-like lactoylglutathione lyase family enzyme
MISAFEHVHLFCRDVEEMAKFFEDFLEAKVTTRSPRGGKPMIRMDLKGIMVMLVTTTAADQLVPGKESRGLDHFAVKVPDLKKAVEEMKRKGGKFSLEYAFTGPPEKPRSVQYAFLDGPDGIRVEVIQRD